jgi:hypothetical protein
MDKNLTSNNLKVQHDKENKQFLIYINGEIAKVVYRLDNDKMYPLSLGAKDMERNLLRAPLSN